MNLFETNKTIIVNGVTMLAKDYRKILKERNNKGKKVVKKKTNVNDIDLMVWDIKSMAKNIKLIRSLSAYYRNGYKQWGTIAQNIIQLDGIRKPFVKYNIRAKEMLVTLNEIESIGKKKDKAIYQYVEKLSYQLDDIRQYIDELCTNIIKSGVLERYRGHECICGKDKRLGLKTLIGRSWGATMELNEMIKHCTNVSSQGLDVFAYTQETYNNFLKH